MFGVFLIRSGHGTCSWEIGSTIQQVGDFLRRALLSFGAHGTVDRSDLR